MIEPLLTQDEGPEKVEELDSFMANMLEEFGYTSGGKTFFLHAALEWLAKNGYLVLMPDGAVTPAGRALSLLSFPPERYGVPKILCGKPAKTLLRDNLEELFAFEYSQWEPLLRVLTPDWHKCATCLTEPVTFTKLLEHINSQLPPDLPRKLYGYQVFNWLAWKGLTETAYCGSRRIPIPSEEGIRRELRKNCVKENKRHSFSQELGQKSDLIERMYYYGKDAEGNAEGLCRQPEVQQYHRDHGCDEGDVPGCAAAGEEVRLDP